MRIRGSVGKQVWVVERIVVEPQSGTDEGIPPDGSELAVDHYVMEPILAGCRPRVEVHEVHTSKLNPAPESHVLVAGLGERHEGL